MERLSEAEIEFVTCCLKEGKPLPDNYRYIIPFESKKEISRLDASQAEFKQAELPATTQIIVLKSAL